MKRHSLQCMIVRKAISLIVLVAFLATDAVYAAPFHSERQSALAPTHRDAQEEYRDEVAAYQKLEKDERDARIGFSGGAIVTTILMILMLLTPFNAEAKGQAGSAKPKEAPLTQLAMNYVNNTAKAMQDSFEGRQVDTARKNIEDNIRLGIDTYLNDPFYGLLQDISVPLDGLEITSGYGKRPPPKPGASGFHEGLDMAATGGEGAPVYASISGKVVEAVGTFDVETGTPGSGYGNVVKVRAMKYGKEVESHYGHLKRVYVKEGEDVDTFTLIGDEGTTGTSTGPHVHYTMVIDGQKINPAFFFDKKMLADSGGQASANQRKDFEDKYTEIWRLTKEGLTLDNAPHVLQLYQEIFAMMGLQKDAEKVGQARKNLDELRQKLDAAAKGGGKLPDPQKSVDDFLKYLGLIFGTVTFSSMRKREEEKLEGGIGELLRTGAGDVTPDAIAGLVSRAIENISEWVRLRGSDAEKSAFSADQLRTELESRAAQIIAASTPPTTPADTNSDVVSSVLPEDRA